MNIISTLKLMIDSRLIIIPKCSLIWHEYIRYAFKELKIIIIAHSWIIIEQFWSVFIKEIRV